MMPSRKWGIATSRRFDGLEGLVHDAELGARCARRTPATRRHTITPAPQGASDANVESTAQEETRSRAADAALPLHSAFGQEHSNLRIARGG